MKDLLTKVLTTIAVSVSLFACGIGGNTYTGTAVMTQFDNNKKEIKKWEIDFNQSGRITCIDKTNERTIYILGTESCDPVTDFGGTGPCSKTTTHYKLTRYFYDNSTCTTTIEATKAGKFEESKGSTYVVNKEDLFSTKYKGGLTAMTLTCDNPYNKKNKGKTVYYKLTPGDYLIPDEGLIKSMLIQAFSADLIEGGPHIKDGDCELDKRTSTDMKKPEIVDDTKYYHFEYKCNKNTILLSLDMQSVQTVVHNPGDYTTQKKK